MKGFYGITNEERAAYRKQEREERAAERAKMEAEFGTADMPEKARDLIWNKAWEDGHSSGYGEVRMHYDDLSDIAKAARNDADHDARDGVLFRFWIRAASYPGGWPSDLMRVMAEEIKAEDQATPAAYRRALMRLAKEKGINLP